jgi:methyltransferase
MSPVIVPALVVAVLLMMLVEAQLSNYNERLLRARGAIEPPDDVIHLMRLAYPLTFVLMGVEGMAIGLADGSMLLVGLAIFTVAKALKLWAIASLGVRWSFKVLVLPGAPLVATGPYRVLRHPNYVAVTGELVGVAIAVGAPITGTIGTLVFVWLMRRRVEIEERALGLRK